MLFSPGLYLPMGKGPAAAVGGGGNVTVDQAGTAAYQANSNNFNYTGLTITGGLTNPGLVCWLIRVHASNDVEAGLTVSWGAQAMTLISKRGNTSPSPNTVFLFGLRNPTSGNQTLTVSGTNVATDNFVNCVSFSNVNQTSDAAAFPNATGADSTASLSITSAAGHVAVSVFEAGGSLGTIIPTIVISDATHGAIVNAGGDYVASIGASTSVGTTASQGHIAGMDISN